jgi:Mor family transcriptional regulator
VQPRDISIYEAFMKGMSVGAIAKNYKMDKSQVKRIINRVSNEARPGQTNVLHELHDNQTPIGGNL